MSGQRSIVALCILLCANLLASCISLSKSQTEEAINDAIAPLVVSGFDAFESRSNCVFAIVSLAPGTNASTEPPGEVGSVTLDKTWTPVSSLDTAIAGAILGAESSEAMVSAIVDCKSSTEKAEYAVEYVVTQPAYLKVSSLGVSFFLIPKDTPSKLYFFAGGQ